MKTLIVTMLLCASTFSLDITSAYEITENCKIIYKNGKIIAKNRAWCNYFIETEVYIILEQKENKWCLDSSWDVNRWKSYFLVEGGIRSKERTVWDVIKTILNRKHKCKMEVI